MVSIWKGDGRCLKTAELSKRQRQILDFIVSQTLTRGYPPSVREIGQAVGLSSSSTVHGHLGKLEEKGFIRRDPTKPRAIELLEPSVRLPREQSLFGHTFGVPSFEEMSRLRRLASPGEAGEAAADGEEAVTSGDQTQTRRPVFDFHRDLVMVPVVGRVAAGSPLLAEENIEDTLPLPRSFVRDERVFMLRVRGESMVGAGILDGDLVVVREQRAAQDGDIVVALLGDEATVKRFFRESDHIRLQPENQLLEPIRVKDVQVLGKVIGLLRRVH